MNDVPRRPPLAATTLRRLAAPMFGLLAIEFGLGMALALFETLPTGGGVASILLSSPVLDLHLLLAVLLIGISARATTIAFRQTDRPPRIGSAVAFGSAIVATAAGWLFAFDGQNPIASFVMALSFLGLLVGAFILRGLSVGSSENPTLEPLRVPRRSPASEGGP